MNKIQIALDIETTGINKNGPHYLNHKIIEIAAIKIINRKITKDIFHVFINPNRNIDIEAYNIHKISNNFLKKKPIFYNIANNLINFIKGHDLIIHNSKFDIGFINYELKLINYNIKIENICNIIDTLSISRKIFPCKKNNLDDLSIRLNINKKKRNKHSALNDVIILVNIYLKLTSKQLRIDFNKNLFYNNNIKYNNLLNSSFYNNKKLKIIFANNKEINNNNIFLNLIIKKYK
ncbi:DNA polymerase III subunit epsilon [Candidatus Nardonella dryophthoridicola]|uniref:DNA polymerase III subunit epsilon n=1 Tax=Candidatus Nardonella dryophthoridicola TaxID=1971485 RepID=UPI001AD8719C|nr:DNA polymerase III subunit epsilon [Candidatus Nardonella dryophthoridicola]QTJ62956.1 DNA polymerase III subunit epsilon [Candidatus Nardonella dryophthoridicola]